MKHIQPTTMNKLMLIVAARCVMVETQNIQGSETDSQHKSHSFNPVIVSRFLKHFKWFHPVIIRLKCDHIILCKFPESDPVLLGHNIVEIMFLSKIQYSVSYHYGSVILWTCNQYLCSPLSMKQYTFYKAYEHINTQNTFWRFYF